MSPHDRLMSPRRSVPLATLALLLTACAGTAPPPDWQLNAKGAMERALQAYLQGNSRVEAVEFARARAELARTGQADVLARAELTRCAARVASLVFEPCAGFDALAQDASAAERAYANYLAGKVTPQDVALLPEQHRAVATASAPATAVAGIADPLARLIAAGVLMQSARAEPAVMALSADTASAQGWSRPLLAWLNVQVMRAEAAGQADEVARLRRRIGLVVGTATRRPAAP
jgi:hypothetical protein